VFAIHGKEDEYPYPAGSYKTEDSKDVSVTAVGTKPKDSILVTIKNPQFDSPITDRQKGRFKFTVENKGNIFLWNTPVSIKADGVKTSSESVIIDSLPPFGKKDLEFTFSSGQITAKKEATIKLIILDNEIYTGNVTIVPYYYKIAYYISIAVLTVSLLYFLLKFLKKRLF
jgi:hypothetical protein